MENELYQLKMKELTDKLLNTTDARVRAEEFCKIYPNMNKDVMICWFAAAIVVGAFGHLD